MNYSKIAIFTATTVLLSGISVAEPENSTLDIDALQRQGKLEGWIFDVSDNPATEYDLADLTGVVEPKNWRQNSRFPELASSINKAVDTENCCGDECGTALTPEVINRTNQMLDDRTWDEARSQDLQNRGTKYVKITVHIVRYSNGTGGIPISRITNSINDLNTHVASTGLEFFIHGDIIYLDSDEYAECTSGEANALRQINPVTGSANIWFVPVCPDFCGRSSFPSSSVQGTIMANDCVDTWWNDSTFSHELGHYFHLFHTHETFYGEECVNGSNCSYSGDLICDTSADPNLSGQVNDNCSYTGTEVDACGSGQQYDPPVHNLMSYSQKLCRDFFTSEQLSIFLWSAENERQNHLTDYITGACCIEQSGACIEIQEYQCLNGGGNWQGLGALCEDGCLQNELGACCIEASEACIEIYEPSCLAGGGVWLGPLTVCADDECVFGCEGDTNGDGEVNVSDLLDVVDQWGLTNSPADVNQDGIVDVIDLLDVVGNWGACQ